MVTKMSRKEEYDSGNMHPAEHAAEEGNGNNKQRYVILAIIGIIILTIVFAVLLSKGKLL